MLRRMAEKGKGVPPDGSAFSAYHGAQERVGGITKQADRYLRQLLVVGALAVVKYAQRNGTRRPWLVKLLARRPTNLSPVFMIAQAILAILLARATVATFIESPSFGPRRRSAPLGAQELGRSDLN